MLVTAEEMLKKAKAGKYAVGQFNINNLELLTFIHRHGIILIKNNIRRKAMI